MAAFDVAVERTLEHEGGLANNPNDRGGLTKYGISQRSYPDLDIESLTKDDARTIYKRDFWDKIQGDKLPNKTAFALFDFAVNSGPEEAVRRLQFALGPNLEIDGIMGPDTIKQAKARAVETSDTAVARALNRGRERNFHSIVTLDPSQGEVLPVWLRRLG